MELIKALQELANDIKEEIIRRMHSSIGVNPRTGENTLEGSRLEKSIEVYPEFEDTIIFEIADYYEYVVSGWRRTHRLEGTVDQFIRNITDWVRRKHVRMGNLTETQIVWYLYKRMLIEEREIKPRPFIESGFYNNEDPSKILPFLDDFFDKWANKVFEEIISDIDKYFNQ